MDQDKLNTGKKFLHYFYVKLLIVILLDCGNIKLNKCFLAALMAVSSLSLFLP